jgi:hypothetical protein
MFDGGPDFDTTKGVECHAPRSLQKPDEDEFEEFEAKGLCCLKPILTV